MEKKEVSPVISVWLPNVSQEYAEQMLREYGTVCRGYPLSSERRSTLLDWMVTLLVHELATRAEWRIPRKNATLIYLEAGPLILPDDGRACRGNIKRLFDQAGVPSQQRLELFRMVTSTCTGRLLRMAADFTRRMEKPVEH